MIRFRDPPASPEPVQTSLAVGSHLDKALALFGQQNDCIGCTVAVAAPGNVSKGAIDPVRRAFSPLAQSGPTIRPDASASGLLRRGGYWTDVDIDARAQRLRSVRMPAALVAAQRVLAVIDLRGNDESRPVIAIGLWAQFAHPIVRMGARFGGTRDGLTTEIALAAHPDRYVLIDSDRRQNLTFVLATPDIIVAELIVLALRERRAPHPGTGPWEDPLVQAATDLDLGVRNADEIDIDVLLSPTLSSEQRRAAAEMVAQAAERIGIAAAR